MKTAEEILTWLKYQKYQTERGEQEYTMYFDIDMPKIINDALNHFNASHPSDVSDEDIEKEFERTHPVKNEYEKMIAVNLAKAVRDGFICKSK